MTLGKSKGYLLLTKVFLLQVQTKVSAKLLQTKYCAATGSALPFQKPKIMASTFGKSRFPLSSPFNKRQRSNNGRQAYIRHDKSKQKAERIWQFSLYFELAFIPSFSLIKVYFSFRQIFNFQS